MTTKTLHQFSPQRFRNGFAGLTAGPPGNSSSTATAEVSGRLRPPVLQTLLSAVPLHNNSPSAMVLPFPATAFPSEPACRPTSVSGSKVSITTNSGEAGATASRAFLLHPGTVLQAKPARRRNSGSQRPLISNSRSSAARRSRAFDYVMPHRDTPPSPRPSYRTVIRQRLTGFALMR
ncbi:MAG: hypothetical protein JWM59_3604 [Verrucomicrobiales bacterium]|nr:hypothetical protein [Verrucomicrobiales bacterium]